MIFCFQIEPVMVFDGAKLPMKVDTEKSRRSYVHQRTAVVHSSHDSKFGGIIGRSRDQNKAKGLILAAEGNSVIHRMIICIRGRIW